MISFLPLPLSNFIQGMSVARFETYSHCLVFVLIDRVPVYQNFKNMDALGVVGSSSLGIDGSFNLSNFEMLSDYKSLKADASYSRSFTFSRVHTVAFIIVFYCVSTYYTNQTSWWLTVPILLPAGASFTSKPEAQVDIAFQANGQTVTINAEDHWTSWEIYVYACGL